MMTDLELLSKLTDLSKVQAKAESEILAYLVEVEARELHLKKAYRSLFEFVRVFLKCSEATASRRVAVVRAAKRFPEILKLIREQRVTVTNLALVAPHLTEANRAELLAKIEGASKHEVEKLVARLTPAQEPKRDVIRPIAAHVPNFDLTSEGSYEENLTGEALILGAPAPVAQNDKVRIAFDAPAELAEKIERLKELHAHKLKDASLAEVISMAVDMLLDKTAPERKAEPKKKDRKPVAAKKSTPKGFKVDSRRPAVALKRQIWRRDGGRCTFTDAKGTRCSATSRLQVDHVRPWAMGGSSNDPENLRLLCRAHNLFMARKYFPARRDPSLCSG